MRCAFSLLAIAVLAARALGAGAAPAPTATKTPMPAYARQYAIFLEARNEPLGRWLPANEDLFEPWRRHHAASATLAYREMFTIPSGATFFWHGNAGPPKVHLVYDPTRRVALYDQGCCTWDETVLAVVSKRPPAAVKAANLAGVRTRRGIGLGASPNAVRRAYGEAVLYPSTTKPSLRVLSYYRRQGPKGSTCGWFENFVFRGARLIEIQAGHGC